MARKHLRFFMNEARDNGGTFRYRAAGDMTGIIFWNGIIKRRCIRQYLIVLTMEIDIETEIKCLGMEHGILSGNRMMWMLSGSG